MDKRDDKIRYVRNSLGYLNGTLKSATPDQYNNILFYFSSYQRTTDMIKNGG